MSVVRRSTTALVGVLAAGLVCLPAAATAETPTIVRPPASTLGAGWAYTVALAPGGGIWGTGKNLYGSLGGNVTGAVQSVSTLTATPGLPPGVSATAVAAGGWHTLVLGSDQVAYSVGDHPYGETAPNELTPVAGLPDGVVAEGVVAGTEASIILGSDGVAYGSGSDQYGQLTPGSHATLAPLTGMPDGVSVVSAANAAGHTALLGSDGVVYVVGDLFSVWPAYAALTALTGLPDGVVATSVAAGQGTVLVTGSDGAAYGVGSGDHGKLTGANGLWSTFHRLDGLPDGVHAVRVAGAATRDYSLVTGDDGAVYLTGDDLYFSPTSPTGFSTTLRRLALPTAAGRAVEAIAGDNTVIVRTADGDVWGAGAADAGQLGTPSLDPLPVPVPLSGQTIRSLAAPRITGTPKVGTRLTATAGSWTLAPSALAYRWRRNGVAISRATGSAYVPTSADLGCRLSVVVRAARPGLVGAASTSASSAPVLRGPALRWTSSARPVITGTPRVGRTLHVTRLTLAGWTPDATSLSYRWMRGTTVVSRTSSYLLRRADVGRRIVLRITAHRPGYADGGLTTASVLTRR